MRLLFVLISLIAVSAQAALTPYPPEVKRSFVQACVKLNKELITPCRCIFDNLEKTIRYKEFERLLADGTIERDSRVAAITQRCQKMK